MLLVVLTQFYLSACMISAIPHYVHYVGISDAADDAVGTALWLQ